MRRLFAAIFLVALLAWGAPAQEQTGVDVPSPRTANKDDKGKKKKQVHLTGPFKWEKNLKKAFKQSKKDGRPVIAYFTYDT